MNLGLYVVTHKKIENRIPKDRKILLVGAHNKDKIEG